MSTIVWNREGVVEEDRWATIEGESAFVSMDEALELAGRHPAHHLKGARVEVRKIWRIPP